MVVIKYERRGQIAIITMYDPATRNAIDSAGAVSLLAAFERFSSDDSLVGILYGEGGVFCAGANLKEVDAGTRALPATFSGLLAPMGPSRMRFSKPLIAAVEGFAVAGGLELALLAHMRVCGASAVFGVFCRRWGVPLIDGGTVRLPRAIGESRALDLILTGRECRAEEALAIGLAQRVVPDGEALNAAVAIAGELCQWPQGTLRADLKSATEALDMALDEGLKNEYERGVGTVGKDGKAGSSKFVKGAGRHGAKL